MAQEPSWKGAMVAVEGPKAVVSTQLRLLPSSPQILILPALDTYLPTQASFLDTFDAVQYLGQVNAAMKQRHRDAQTFLRGRGAERGTRRLVFLEGGAASAHALCLKALMQHETAGDRAAAAAVLDRLVRHGLAGLAQAGQERHHSAPVLYAGVHGVEAEDEDEDETSDPSTRAMRAADALDRQTANLQVSNELDLTIRRSSSLPLYGYADTPSGNAAPFLVFGQSSLEDCTPTTERLARSPFLDTPRFSVVQYDRHAEMPSVFGFDDFSTTTTAKSSPTGDGRGVSSSTSRRDSRRRSTTARGGRLSSDHVSPLSDAFSVRSSVGKVEYGRASLLDMRTSVRGDGFMGVKAVGRSTATHKPKLNELTIDETTTPPPRSAYNNNMNGPARILNENLLSTTNNNTTLSSSGDTMPSTLMRVPSTTSRPRTIVVKRTRPVIKLQRVPSAKKRRWQQSKSTYIDDDGDAAAPTTTTSSQPREPDSDSSYEPVFPRMEDLVLYLRSELTPQPLLESALNAMREEYMRKSLSASACLSPSSAGTSSASSGGDSLSTGSQTDDGTAMLTSPETSCTEQDLEDQETPKTAVINMTAAAPVVALPSMDDYDPFAYSNPSYGASAQLIKSSEPATVTILRPPTPAQTPPPPTPPPKEEAQDGGAIALKQRQQPEEEPDTEKEVIEELDSTIHEIAVEAKQPPVAVQNAIRSVLRQHCPVATPASGSYTPQFQLPPLLPNSISQPDNADDDDESLWRPLFRSRKTSSLPPVGGVANGGGHQLKQILAVGLQSGVRRDYAARVIAQIEKFGTEPTGAARCTRLDFRYLLAHTMQAYTSQPLRSQAANPFASPALLATVMLPHLETYLAVHADIRFLLLEYPPEHLPTVVAMQKLAGVDLVKIAQLVDTTTTDARGHGTAFQHVREHSVESSRSRSSSTVSAVTESGSIYSCRSSSLSSRSTTPEASRAKANFLLASSASDKDIAQFVSAVWNLPAATTTTTTATVQQRPQSAPGVTAEATTTTADSSLPLREKLQQQAPAVSSFSRLSAAATSSSASLPLREQQAPAVSSFSKLSAPETSSSASLPLREQQAPPVSSFSKLSAAETSSSTSLPEQQQKSQIKRKAKPAPLRVNALSAFPKTTGPQSPLSPSVSTMSSVLAPPPLMRPHTSGSNAATFKTEFYTPVSSPALPRTPPSPDGETTPRGQHGAMRVSAVGGGSSNNHLAAALRRRPSTSSSMRTTRSNLSTMSKATTTHIAYMRRKPAPSSSSSSRTFNPLSSSSTPQELLPPVPRFLHDSEGSSTLLHHRLGLDPSDGASIMTFDPAEDSDYDQEERRLMPMYGKKLRRKKPGTQKALKVLGMMA